MQMVTHGLVVAPLFVIILLLRERAGGSELLSRMGGLAYRAPVLAALFLIVTLATLAMPGSANFVGELLVLFGALRVKAGLRPGGQRRRRARGRLHDSPLPERRCTARSPRASCRVRCPCATG